MTVQAEKRSKRKTSVCWYLIGPLAAVIALPALLYLCAVLLAKEILPFTVMEELVIACVFLTGTISAVAACAGRGGKVMQTGLCMGCVLAAAIVIITLAAPGEGPFTSATLKHVIAAITGGCFGGALSIKRKKPSVRRKKRR